ncbi:hypothetical protein UlMin_032472 [Ulmus minor]
MDYAYCLKFLNQTNHELDCGYLMLRLFSRVFNLLVLFLFLGMGLKLLQVSSRLSKSLNLMQIICNFRGKAEKLGNGFCSKCDFDEFQDQNFISCKCGGLKFSEDSHHPNTNGKEEEEECNYNEEEEFNVLELRKLVRKERKRANRAGEELEKERMAAASAAEEAMTMILRLQNEKSCVEMEANQYRLMAEHRKKYDQEVIESLQWIVMRHESERSALEEQLRLCLKENGRCEE